MPRLLARSPARRMACAEMLCPERTSRSDRGGGSVRPRDRRARYPFRAAGLPRRASPEGHNRSLLPLKGSCLRADFRRVLLSRMCGPELILTLLIAFVLPEGDGTAVPYSSNMDLPRRPAPSSPARALGAQHDDPVAVGQNRIDLKLKRALG
jgi:hypothetical protein